MTNVVPYRGGWFDPHGTESRDALQVQEHEQRMAAENYLGQKLLTIHLRLPEGDALIIRNSELVQLAGALEMSTDDVYGALRSANDEFKLGLKIELSTHQSAEWRIYAKRVPSYLIITKARS